MTTILDPAVSEPDLDFAQAKRFRKLSAEVGLGVDVAATRVLVDAVLYVATTSTHKAGDVRTPEAEHECVTLTAIAPDKTLAVQAFWENKSFMYAKWGGPALDPVTPRVYWTKKITEMYQAIQGFKGHEWIGEPK